MGKVVELFRETSFDPDTLRIMGAAFECAQAALDDRGQPEIVYEVIAKRIIAMASDGERDVLVLAERALEALGPDVLKKQA